MKAHRLLSPFECWILPHCPWVEVRGGIYCHQDPYSLVCVQFLLPRVSPSKVIIPGHTTVPSFEPSVSSVAWEVASLATRDRMSTAGEIPECEWRQEAIDSLHDPAETLNKACVLFCLVVGGLWWFLCWDGRAFELLSGCFLLVWTSVGSF